MKIAAIKASEQPHLLSQFSTYRNHGVWMGDVYAFRSGRVVWNVMENIFRVEVAVDVCRMWWVMAGVVGLKVDGEVVYSIDSSGTVRLLCDGIC